MSPVSIKFKHGSKIFIPDEIINFGRIFSALAAPIIAKTKKAAVIGGYFFFRLLTETIVLNENIHTELLTHKKKFQTPCGDNTFNFLLKLLNKLS